MDEGNVRAFDAPRWRRLMDAPLPRSYTNYLGYRLFRLLVTVQGIGAFALITFGVILTKPRVARVVIAPLIRKESSRSGLNLFPMFLFLSVALGLVVIGQAVSFLNRLNATGFLGMVMVMVVVRELGPLLTALLVLLRSGTANVIDLGTSRALGEVEALEALGIDPVHYLVVPRVIGMALGVFSLTIYFIIGAVLSGYLWAFLQNVPLRPGEYFGQFADALSVLDFVVLALKSCAFGVIIAVVTCYHGLAQPLRLEEVSQATIGAMVQSLLACVAIDVLFIIIYLAV